MSMRRSIATSVMTALALAVLAVAPGLARDQYTEEFHQSYPLNADGRVSVSNVNGWLHVETWDRNEVKVDALKHARSEDRLKEARIEIRNHQDSIRIETRYPEDSHHEAASVDYTLTIPRGARLSDVDLVNGDLVVNGLQGGVHASLVNGHASANGLGGDVEVSTVNGGLEVACNRLGKQRHVSLHSVNGQVTLHLPSDASAEVSAETVNGGIDNDFGLQEERGEYVGHSLNGRIGDGETEIHLENVNGRISIRKT